MRSVPSRLLVFLKPPRPGAVKTRLAAALGPDAACAAYAELLETLLARLSALPGVQLCYAPPEAKSEIKPWLRPGWTACPQTGGDLGARLQAAFSDHFKSDAQRVVIIGSDCPEVTAADIEDAWLALEAHDVVIGPALDGGYWLIGLRAPRPGLFTSMPWSTDRVFTETMCRARDDGLRVAVLRELADVDTIEDWERWRARTKPSS
jgi:uncharacterized protein